MNLNSSVEGMPPDMTPRARRCRYTIQEPGQEHGNYLDLKETRFVDLASPLFHFKDQTQIIKLTRIARTTGIRAAATFMFRSEFSIRSFLA